jgi:hypothetical protein
MARLLLRAAAGDNEAEFVAGDLHEEFVCLCDSLGPRRARRWYRRQVFRSLFPLWALRMRNGEIAHVAAAAGLGVALPLLLLDRLWQFVYSLIPLKDGLDRAPGFLAANVICACLLAASCGATAGSSRRAMAIAWAASAAAAFAVWGSAGAAPAVYVGALLVGVPAAAMLAFRWKREPV